MVSQNIALALPLPPNDGWRDEPYAGPDVCEECAGWGTVTEIDTDRRVAILLSCEECLARGYLTP